MPLPLIKTECMFRTPNDTQLAQLQLVEFILHHNQDSASLCFLIFNSTCVPCVCSEVFKRVSAMLLKAVIDKGLSEVSRHMHQLQKDDQAFHPASLFIFPSFSVYFQFSWFIRIRLHEKLMKGFVSLTDQSFDIPDRTFHSMNTTWRLSSYESMTDVKELIPEFFYLPEFLVNREGVRSYTPGFLDLFFQHSTSHEI